MKILFKACMTAEASRKPFFANLQILDLFSTCSPQVSSLMYLYHYDALPIAHSKYTNILQNFWSCFKVLEYGIHYRTTSETPGEVLPHSTYTGMCRPTGSWFWSSWFRTGYPFQRRFLERGIIFRMHKSSSFVSSHLKLFKDRLLWKIRFNALTSKLLYSCCTLERSVKNGPISRMGYQFWGEF